MSVEDGMIERVRWRIENRLRRGPSVAAALRSRPPLYDHQ